MELREEMLWDPSPGCFAQEGLHLLLLWPDFGLTSSGDSLRKSSKHRQRRFACSPRDRTKLLTVSSRREVPHGEYCAGRRAAMVHPSPTVEAVDCDFLIVGAGSSACVLASRLVRAGLKVLLVEKGPTDAATLSKLVTRPADWLRAAFTGRGLSEAFVTVPQTGLDNRRVPAPRGQGGGGTSNVNVGLYQRGRCVDYAVGSRSRCSERQTAAGVLCV